MIEYPFSYIYRESESARQAFEGTSSIPGIMALLTASAALSMAAILSPVLSRASLSLACDTEALMVASIYCFSISLAWLDICSFCSVICLFCFLILRAIEVLTAPNIRAAAVIDRLTARIL